MDRIQQPNPPVWLAIVRDGIDFHAGIDAAFQSTVCGRSTRTGTIMDMSEALALNSKPCPRCVAIKFDRAW